MPCSIIARNWPLPLMTLAYAALLPELLKPSLIGSTLQESKIMTRDQEWVLLVKERGR